MHRYRCCRCGRTFRYYPEGTNGVDHLYLRYPGLSVQDRLAQADETVAVVCGDLLEIRIELSQCEHDSEWLEDRIMSNDGLAGCPGAE